MNAILNVLLSLRVNFGNRYLQFGGSNLWGSCVPWCSHVLWNSGYTCGYITFNFHWKTL